MTPQEKALLLIECIEQSLTRGVKHYDKAGTELTTPLEIIKCLLKEGGFKCEETLPFKKLVVVLWNTDSPTNQWLKNYVETYQ